MREADARPASVHDRGPFDGSAAILGNREPSFAEIDNASERGALRQDGVTALPRLAAADAGDDSAPTRAVP